MKTWASETLTSSDMTTYLTDNIEYLYGKVSGLTASGVQLKRTSNLTVADSSAVNIAFQAESFDYGGWWSSGSAVTVPSGAIPSGSTAVLCLVVGRLRWATNGTGVRRVRPILNGTSFGSTTIDGQNGDDTDMSITEFTTVSDGDVLYLEAYQTSGGNLDLEVGNFTIIRLFPAE